MFLCQLVLRRMFGARLVRSQFSKFQEGIPVSNFGFANQVDAFRTFHKWDGSMNWALSGASTIASQFMVTALRNQPEGAVRWVVSGSATRATEFSKLHAVPRSGHDIAEALGDPAVDAVYISSTNDQHKDQALAAIAGGKHVLCEKPLALTSQDAAQIVAAAKAAGVVFATNHHLRCSGTRGNAQNYDDWRQMGCVGWGYDDVLPYFRKAEDNDTFDNRFHGKGGPLGVSQPIAPLPICEAYFKAAAQIGIPRNMDINGEAQDGVCYYQLTQRHARRSSAAMA